MNPRLVAINGSLKGSTFPLNEAQISIGRESASSVSLSHNSVSRRHCLIKRNGDEFTICDLDSFNGTFVNGVPVKEQTLVHADQIKIGSIALLFLIGESENPSSGNLVQLDDSSVVAHSTRQMRPETLLHETDRALLQSPEYERVTRDLGALCKIGSRINLLRHTQELQHEILNSIFEVVPVDPDPTTARKADERQHAFRDQVGECALGHAAHLRALGNGEETLVSAGGACSRHTKQGTARRA